MPSRVKIGMTIPGRGEIASIGKKFILHVVNTLVPVRFRDGTHAVLIHQGPETQVTVLETDHPNGKEFIRRSPTMPVVNKGIAVSGSLYIHARHFSNRKPITVRIFYGHRKHDPTFSQDRPDEVSIGD